MAIWSITSSLESHLEEVVAAQHEEHTNAQQRYRDLLTSQGQETELGAVGDETLYKQANAARTAGRGPEVNRFLLLGIHFEDALSSAVSALNR